MSRMGMDRFHRERSTEALNAPCRGSRASRPCGSRWLRKAQAPLARHREGSRVENQRPRSPCASLAGCLLQRDRQLVLPARQLGRSSFEIVPHS
jgi:hypothetical protein